ncbi:MULTISPECIES: Holliday junction branch migration protein RuvA [Pseudobutyrivibrio]|jgi:Holliday junction DNA helicase RuvA|uniref:Holliday junction branch migration complex subunit RuvA n=2 Tax=Pseudobutyrivibrio TaxID=46205 RepID=A0A2G3EDZ9_9FIRM|nr:MULTISPECIES: Holliday junction branch migration protein RuvA [Pseudobutyrivibrio]NEX01098.1 Holliday junction branch migration protein RuvA [Pseudobutyrivibrio xylanivorans]PHU34989.1 Holliday junction branch migration protein RuvA [Pseudobutyrivibrio ruminis]PHU41494.1 Holliday junction branch migration protein RuvA [Pseudobutyrivibrio ruminis]SFR64991.1 Holliday junction DNA helicase subunit RuvA [Pseudobutyrivibrio sp. NOR37]
MITYIRGTLSDIDENIVIVENNGIGYGVSSSMNTIRQLPAIGSEVKLETKLIPKEDSLTLYGFYDKEELKMFELLLSVSGIGPKGALSILSSMTVSDIQFAVAGSDAKAFAAVPGVGKKTAERAIIDLKDKVDIIGAFEAKITADLSGKKVSPAVSVKEEVLEALVALGYSASNAARALDKMTITDSTTTEQLLSDTLKQMSFL